jgi:hypothetical protein
LDRKVPQLGGACNANTRLESHLSGAVLRSVPISISHSGHFSFNLARWTKDARKVSGVLDDWAKETAHLASAMTSPSTYQFDFINITNLVVAGGGVDQYDTSNRFVAMDTVHSLNFAC